VPKVGKKGRSFSRCGSLFDANRLSFEILEALPQRLKPALSWLLMQRRSAAPPKSGH
jgi:hypothetical protein